MRDYVVASLVLGAVAVGGAAALRPDPAVKFEAELSRLEPEDALGELRQVEGAGGIHGNLELMYGRLALADGELDEARRSFLRLLSQVGPSEEILEALAGIALVAGDLPMAAVYLRQAHDAFPAPHRRARLAGWYRSLRMAEAEIALLQSASPMELSTREVERLALLLIGAGRVDEYEKLLSTLAESDTERALSFKPRPLEFLVEAGRPGDAAAAAIRWAGEEEGGKALEVSVRALIGRGEINAAITVAREGFRLAPEDAHVVLPVFARSGHGGIARLLQDEWLAKQPALSEREWATLIFLAESTGDMRGLQRALGRHGAKAGPESAGRALMQFLRYRGAGALVPHRALLSQEVLQAAPLVGAAWARWRGDQAATYGHLLAAANEPLGEWDQMIWMSLLEGLQGSPFHRSLLAGATNNPDLRHRLRETVIPVRPASVAATGLAERPG